MPIPVCLPLLLLASLQAPRSPEPDPDLARFRALDEVDRSTVVRGLTRRLQLDGDPVIQRIVSLQRGHHTWPLAAPPTFHDPARWAKGVAPTRTLVRAGTPVHDAVRARIPRVTFLPDLACAVWYDWGQGRVVRREKPLSDEEVFANLLAGYPPDSDQAVARTLALLDERRPHAKVAAWADRLYADLDAKAYEGVTLYEAWYAGVVLDVPDVDAIPFAVEILGSKAYRSPIPAGPQRTALYQAIRERMLAYRLYRTLREAAAAAFVRAEPALDETYASLVPRFHFLYAEQEEDPLAVARFLQGLAGREEFLTWSDRAIKESREAYDRQQERLNALAAMAARIRAMALGALEQ